MDVHPHPKPTGIISHVVQPGDTLESISRRYYGTPTEWPRIFHANRSHTSGTGLLREGAEITVPQ